MRQKMWLIVQKCAKLLFCFSVFFKDFETKNHLTQKHKFLTYMQMLMSANNYHLYCVFLWLSQIIFSMKLRNNLHHEFVQSPHNESCDQYKNYAKIIQ